MRLGRRSKGLVLLAVFDSGCTTLPPLGNGPLPGESCEREERAARKNTARDIRCLLVPRCGLDTTWPAEVRSLDPDEAVPLLTKLLDGEIAGSENSRLIAISALVLLHDSRALPALERALDARNPLVRGRATEALCAWPRPRDASLAQITRGLEDRDSFVRERSARALACFRDEQTRPILLRALRSPDSSVRRAAVEGLGRLDAMDDTTARKLEELLQDADPLVRKSVVEGLRRHGWPVAEVDVEADAGAKDARPPTPASLPDAGPPDAATAPTVEGMPPSLPSPPPPAAALSPADRAAILREMLRVALVQKKLPDYKLVQNPRRVIVSAARLEGPLPSLPGIDLVVMTPEAIQKRANRKGSFVYVVIGEIVALDSGAQGSIRALWAFRGADRRPMINLGGGVLHVRLFRQPGVGWSGRAGVIVYH
jgi:hypothetical protein